MLPRPELRGPVAYGQSTGQLHRRLRRAGLPDVPEHREGATAEEAGHAAAHQDDPQATGPRACAAHERHTLGAGRFRRDPATRATDLDPDSDNAPGQHPRAIYQGRSGSHFDHTGIAIAQQPMWSEKLRKYLDKITLDLVEIGRAHV